MTGMDQHGTARPTRVRWALTGLFGFGAGFVLAALLALLLAWVFFWWSGRHIDLSRATVVQHVQQLQRLETVVYSMEKIVSGSQESRYLPRLLAGDRLLLIVYGEVTAGVDLAHLDQESLQVRGDVVELVLPAAEISRPGSTTRALGCTRAKRDSSRVPIPISNPTFVVRPSVRFSRPHSTAASWRRRRLMGAVRWRPSSKAWVSRPCGFASGFSLRYTKMKTAIKRGPMDRRTALRTLAAAPLAARAVLLAQGEPWTPLFNGRDLASWDTFLGKPYRLTDFSDLPKDARGEYTQAVGLNRDPRGVFSVVPIDGEPAIRISGETFGGLITRAEYEDYHLRFEFRWGEKRWAPREEAVRDSGCCYHSVGPLGASYGFWMRSFEFQIQEGDCGDFYSLAGVVVDAEAVAEGRGESEERSAVHARGAEDRRHHAAHRQGRQRRVARSASGTRSISTASARRACTSSMAGPRWS